MGDLIAIKRTVHTEARSKYSSHTGDIYVEVLRSEDGEFCIEHIYAASPTESHFNDSPLGSLLFDTDDFTTFKIHQAAAVWKDVTGS